MLFVLTFYSRRYFKQKMSFQSHFKLPKTSNLNMSVSIKSSFFKQIGKPRNKKIQSEILVITGFKF